MRAGPRPGPPAPPGPPAGRSGTGRPAHKGRPGAGRRSRGTAALTCPEEGGPGIGALSAVAQALRVRAGFVG